MFDDTGTETKYYWDRGYMADESISGNITAQNYIGMGGVFARQTLGGTSYMLKNGHGDVTSLVSGGTVTKTYDYDAYGKEKNADKTDTNPFRYCGEYTDLPSGMLYLRNRYYNSSNGRFITEDTHWNVGNMIYGDTSEKNSVPSMSAILQSSNLYSYCENNPINRIDLTGCRSKEAADNIIKNNAQNIINAAAEFGVNPAILAATIYAEQRLNVNWKDDLIDPLASDVLDVSLGVGQIRISTAIKMEDKGYMGKTVYYEWHTNNAVENRSAGVAIKLQNDSTNIRYAAAYLSYIQDLWKSSYPEIDGRTAILATLYNLGTEQTSPNANPQSNSFGDFARENYYHMRDLLGLN